MRIHTDTAEKHELDMTLCQFTNIFEDADICQYTEKSYSNDF